MDEGGVDAAVIHPRRWLGPKFGPKWHSRRSTITLVVSNSPPLDRPELRACIAGWRDQPGMFKIYLRTISWQWLKDGTIDWLWAEAGVLHRHGDRLLTDLDRPTPLRLVFTHRSPRRRGGMTTLKDVEAEGPATADLRHWRSSQRGGQSDRCAWLFRSGLLQVPARYLSAPDYARSQPHVLGHPKMPCSWRQGNVFTEEFVGSTTRTNASSAATRSAPGGVKPKRGLTRRHKPKRKNEWPTPRVNRSRRGPIPLKWQSIIANTCFVHGKTLDDSDPLGRRWGVGGVLPKSPARMF